MSDGLWWSGTVGSVISGRHLTTWTGNVYAQNTDFRGNGFALRGVAKITPTCNGVTGSTIKQ